MQKRDIQLFGVICYTCNSLRHQIQFTPIFFLICNQIIKHELKRLALQTPDTKDHLGICSGEEGPRNTK